MKFDYDVLFLGGLFPKEFESEIVENSKGNIQNAANVFQWSLVTGFDQNLINPVKILNLPYIGSFPFRYKKLMVATEKFKHSIAREDINIGFCNLILLKNISRWFAIKKYLREWALDGNKNKVVYAYALTGHNTKALKYIKKLNKNITTNIIVPDLPIYMNTTKNSSFFYDKFKKEEIKYIDKNKKNINKYVFLTQEMAQYMKIAKENYVIVEGISDKKDYINIVKEKKIDENLKYITYTGTLNELYGVKNLVDIFMKIKNRNLRLVICGDGDSRKYIEEKAKEDSRIVYKGIVPRLEILKIQKSATILVNPRENNEEFCKYSFPSKIIEYMMADVPIIAYKLDGIPDEYDEFLHYVKNNEELLNMIIQLSNDSDFYMNLAKEKNSKFIIEKKNCYEQVKKILETLN